MATKARKSGKAKRMKDLRPRKGKIGDVRGGKVTADKGEARDEQVQ